MNLEQAETLLIRILACYGVRVVLKQREEDFMYYVERRFSDDRDPLGVAHSFESNFEGSAMMVFVSILIGAVNYEPTYEEWATRKQGRQGYEASAAFTEAIGVDHPLSMTAYQRDTACHEMLAQIFTKEEIEELRKSIVSNKELTNCILKWGGKEVEKKRDAGEL